MNPWFVTAGALSLITAGIHAILGGPEIHDVIQASSLPTDVRAVSAVIWHGITAIMLVNGGMLIHAARDNCAGSAVMLIVMQYASFTALFIVCNITFFGTLFVMPQWTIFSAITALCITGLMRGCGKAATRPA